MSKETKKFNSLEELNKYLYTGKTVYSLANCGNIWFIEYEENEYKCNYTFDEIVAVMYNEKIIERYGFSGRYIEIKDSLRFSALCNNLKKHELEQIRNLLINSRDMKLVDTIIESK